MARPQKQTVDYYPHVAKCGKTIFILERRWGNDGYAAFHKILETLCTTDGHIINYGNPVEREYLIAKTLVPEQTLTEIIELLVSLGKFDAELWKEHKIWYQKLVDSIADVYKKRVVELPQKPVSDDINAMSQEFPVTETNYDGVSGDGNPQSKLNKTKLKYFNDFWDSYPRREKRVDAERAWKKIKESEYEKVMQGVNAYKVSIQGKEKQYIAMPSTWLNGRRWEDEIDLSCQSKPESLPDSFWKGQFK